MRRWWEIVGCERPSCSTRTQTHSSRLPASRLTIATRVGSASALKRAARSCLASSARGGAPGEQHASITAKTFIDVYQYIVYTSTGKGGDAVSCCEGCCDCDD